TINQVWVEGIRGDVAVLLNAYGMPVPTHDLAVTAPAGHRGRTALLLAPINPVRELVVGDDMVELRGRLVVPCAPGLASVHRDNRPLIACKQHDLGQNGIDPDGVVVVPARRTLDGVPGPAAIARAIGRSIRDKYGVRVLGMDTDLGEIEPATVQACLMAYAL